MKNLKGPMALTIYVAKDGHFSISERRFIGPMKEGSTPQCGGMLDEERGVGW